MDTLSNKELLGETDVYCCNCGYQIETDDLLKLKDSVECPICNQEIDLDEFESVYWEENSSW